MMLDTPPRVLLLHGFLATSQCWRPVIAALDGAVSVCAPDLPGHGRARRNGPFTLEHTLELLLPFVEREQPTHLVGHSMGAIVALALAARLPGHFQRVGLVSLPLYDSPAAATAYIGPRSRLRGIGIRHARAAHAGCTALNALRPLWSPVSPRLRVSQPSLVASWFDHTFDAHRSGLAAVVFAGLVPSLADHVAAPVSLLHSRHDRSAPLTPVEDLAARRDWDLALTGGGHQVIIDHPDFAARWLRTRVLAP